MGLGKNSRARRLRDEGKIDEAIALFNEIIDTTNADDDRLSAKEGIISTYALIGEYDEAIAAAVDTLKFNESSTVALNALELANKYWSRPIPKEFFEQKEKSVAQANLANCDADDVDRAAEQMAANMKEESIRQGVEYRNITNVVTDRKVRNANDAAAVSDY